VQAFTYGVFITYATSLASVSQHLASASTLAHSSLALITSVAKISQKSVWYSKICQSLCIHGDNYLYHIKVYSVGYNACHWQYGSIFIRLAVDCSQICKIPRNSSKIQTYSKSSKAINIGVNQKHICNFLLVTNSNFGRIDAFCSKIACFSYSTLVWCPLVEKRPAIST